MRLQTGTRLGPYEITAEAGAGGMGEVYRARDTRLERTVAIKIIPAHLADHPDLKQRFEREARAISSLSHPHICHLYDVGSQDGIEYLVMEYLEGETLADRLMKGALPMEQVLRIGSEVADALDKGAFEVGQVRRLFHQDASANGMAYDATRDGKKFLFNVGTQDASAPLNLVVNWTAEVKK